MAVKKTGFFSRWDDFPVEIRLMYDMLNAETEFTFQYQGNGGTGT